MLFQKRVMCTKLDVYVFIEYITAKLSTAGSYDLVNRYRISVTIFSFLRSVS